MLIPLPNICSKDTSVYITNPLKTENPCDKRLSPRRSPWIGKANQKTEEVPQERRRKMSKELVKVATKLAEAIIKASGGTIHPGSAGKVFKMVLDSLKAAK